MSVLTQRTMAWLLVSLWLMCAPGSGQTSRENRSKNIPEKSYAMRAVDALFSASDLQSARNAAREALKVRRSPAGATSPWVLDATFVEMEAAALEGDTESELDTALRICESQADPNDARVRIAASRVLDLAANTTEFRAEIPRIKAFLKSSSTAPSELRAALLSAAADGAPGLSALDLARRSGLITDWRIAGPFGELPNVDFERVWEPEGDWLARPKYGERQVEEFRFETGNVTLPSYFGTDGVFYAAAQVTTETAGEWLFRIESGGTLQAWVDGQLVLTKDDRFAAGPEMIGGGVQLKAGAHRVLIKFLNSAVPFRVALVAVKAQKTSTRASSLRSEIPKAYLDAAQEFWAGNYARTVELLDSSPENAPTEYLMAQARLRAGDPDSSRIPLLISALNKSPSAQAANHELAVIALAQGRTEEALQREKQVLEARPRFEAAARVAAAAASKLGRRDDAADAFRLSVELHPSCTVLKDAAAYFDSISEFGEAADYEARQQGCAPGSLAWAEALARSGRHEEAAVAARRVVARNPLDRDARMLVIQELKLAGERQAAKIEADELVAIAPNARDFREIATQLGTDELRIVHGTRASSGEQFHSAYRRNGLDIVKQVSPDKFSGSTAVVLLNDKVVRVNAQGRASVYVHKITRVLDRDGILRFGEVSVPSDAELLELRTIKKDGSIVEPELTAHKSTISMPALAPGDAIEVEYVARDVEGGVDGHPGDFQFTFGSFSAPIALSRFVVISPVGDTLRFVPSGPVPTVKMVPQGGVVERAWEANDIAQSNSETSMPKTGILPSVSVVAEEPRGWEGVRDFYREEFIAAVRAGSAVVSAARQFLSSTTEEERLREAYRFVTQRVSRGDVDYESGEIPTAEQTLSSFTGSRTAALLAIAKAMEIEGEVLMARDVSPERLTNPSAHAYTRSLLLFHVQDAGGELHDVLLDAETEGIGFGGIPATVERRDALRVSIFEPATGPAIATLPAPSRDDHSVAEGEVAFNANGDLKAHLVIRMGAVRGAQMRATLAGIDPAERKKFFEQLAGRIFPGVSFAEGHVENESDPDHALTLVVDCRAEKFVSFGGYTTELDQLVPGLGLKSMYSTGGSRRMPLLIQTPLIETATFRIHLPAGLQFQPRFRDVVENTEFGSYSVTVKAVSAETVEVRRQFDIPVQIIEPRRFESFSRFARNVDEAERQRLVVQRAEPGRVAKR